MKRTLTYLASMACNDCSIRSWHRTQLITKHRNRQTDNQVMDHLDVLTNRIGGPCDRLERIR